MYATKVPYAALPFWQWATDAARDELFFLRMAYDASWAQEGTRQFPVPTDLEYFPFQSCGIDYALGRQHTIIGDQPGLGKTIQAIGVANELRMKRILVLCPASVRIQWYKKVMEWSTLRRRRTVPLAYAILRGRDGVPPDANWTILSYDLCRTDTIHEQLRAMGHFDMLVLDEGHYLKSPETQRTRSVFGGGEDDPFHGGLAAHAEKVVALTGTPLPNRPRECYTLVRGMNWDAIDRTSLDRFQHRYNPSMRIPDGGGLIEKVGRLPELQARLRCNLMVRRRKKDVLHQLPDVTYEVIRVDETKKIKEVTKAENMLGLDKNAVAAGGRMDFDGEVSTVRRLMGEAIAPFAAEQAEMLLGGGLEKLLIFAWHRSVIGFLREKLEHWGVVTIDGSLSSAGKHTRVQRFREEPDVQVCIGQIISSGTGVDGLQDVCAHALFAEHDWVHGNNEQAVDRLWRIGQNAGVLAQFLVAPKSISEYILSSAIEKAGNTDAALDKR
ncbi:DEAD/DEAH box helicase [uncultured Rhodospira sp.]|uniref:DEAD/DEAH box helicase n=1 Tax=uncultured Rhodospira sp. TaxID=1936189 RepID=UPI00260EBD83|nr:DEAD/DEAH box helicase [uncultured Rhodospira sp.]